MSAAKHDADGAGRQVERLLNLAAVFFAARRPVPFDEIVGRVAGYDDDAPAETLEKRFKRDRAGLAEAGVVVDYVGGDDAGYRVREDMFLAPTALSEEESGLLMLAVVAAGEALGDGALSDAALSGWRKIAGSAPGARARPKPASFLRKTAALHREPEIAAVFAEACAAGRRVRFDYRGLKDAASRPREAAVWGLGTAGGRWIMVGFDHDRRAVRNFRLERVTGIPKLFISAPEPTDVAPPDFRVADHLPGRTRAETVELTLKVDGGAAAAARIADAAVRPAESAAGDGLFLAEALIDEGLIGRVLAASGSAEIVSPPRLRAELRRRAANIASAHKKKVADA